MTPSTRSVAPTERNLSEWSGEQQRLLRKVLLDYKGRVPEGNREQSWIDIQADILDITGVHMGGKDTLRQFVAGTRSIDNAERRRAIVQFLTHEEVDALSMEEYLAPESPYHAPRRLLEYLESGQDIPDAEHPLHRLCGTYRAEHRESDELLLVTLLLSEIDHARILRVDELHETYARAESAPLRQPNADHDVPRARKECRGWCLMTPEDNILFFMKETRFGSNHYYHLLADLNIWTAEPEKRLVVFRYDYPRLIEFDGGSNINNIMKEAMAEKPFVFNKIA